MLQQWAPPSWPFALSSPHRSLRKPSTEPRLYFAGQHGQKFSSTVPLQSFNMLKSEVVSNFVETCQSKLQYKPRKCVSLLSWDPKCFSKSLLVTPQLCKTTLRLHLIPTALPESCDDEEKHNFIMPLMKAPLPKIPVQEEAGVRQESWHKHWTNSTHINSVMDFVQLSNLSDGKWSFRKQSKWWFLYFFTVTPYKISNTITRKKKLKNI